MVICQNPQCQKPNADGVKFCKYCGWNLKRIQKCPQCRSENDEEALYCQNCGGKLSSSEPPTPRPSPKPINPHIFTFSFWIGLLFLLMGIILSDSNSAVNVVFIIMGIALMGTGYVYFLVALYRCWALLQGFTARTTPGKAVGYLFIPLFNLYWLFVAIKGLARDANEFLEQRDIQDHRISEDFSLVACILTVIPYINTLSPIFDNILIYQWARFNNFTVKNWDHLSRIAPKKATKPLRTHTAVVIVLSIVGGIFVIGILAAIAIPQFVMYRERAYCAQSQAELMKAYDAAQGYLADHPDKRIDRADILERYGFRQSPGVDISMENFSTQGGFITGKHEKCRKTYVMKPDGKIVEK